MREEMREDVRGGMWWWCMCVCVNGVRSRKGGNLERRNLERGNLKEIDSSSSSVYMVYIVRGVGGSNSRSFVILSLGRNRVLLAGLST